MTLPSVVRIFFAIDIPASLKESLGQYISALKKTAKTHGIRWSKPDNLHITLQFLSHVKTEDLDKVVASVQSHLHQVALSPEALFTGLQVYPSPFRPRVIVLEVQPQHDLTALSRVVGEGIEAIDYQIDQRPFRPHMTLGRIKQPQDVNLHFLSQLDLPDFGILKPAEVTLFRSEPQADGSLYTAINHLPLLTSTVKSLGTSSSDQ